MLAKHVLRSWYEAPPTKPLGITGLTLVVWPDSAVPQDTVDAADARDGLWVTDLLRQELLADLPGEHARVLLLAAQDLLDDRGRGHLLQPITSVTHTTTTNNRQRQQCTHYFYQRN